MEKSVRCNKSISKNERKSIQDGGVTHDVIWFRECDTEEKTGDRVGGSRGLNVEGLFGNDEDGSDQKLVHHRNSTC